MKIFCNASNSSEFGNQKRKAVKRSSNVKGVHDRRRVTVKSSEEVFDSFEDWLYSDSSEADFYEFIETLESLVYDSPDYQVVDFFEEPSVQAFEGTDVIEIELSNEDTHGFYFDWEEEQLAIYEHGPVDAAQMYFAEIDRSIKDGTSLEVF